jgi:glycosyltransferase involved in cell wall biosynthesis
MITTFYPPYNFGGDGVFVHQLSNELARRGHQVDVIHCIDSYRLLAGAQPKGRYDNHPNVTVHGLKSPFGLLSPLATQQTGFPLFKLSRITNILEKGFDVIHYHNISLVGGPKLLEYGSGIKLYTMHEYWLFCPMHVLFRFNRAICEQPHCFACALTHKRPPQWWRHLGLLKAAMRQVDTFIAPSIFSKEIHHRMGLDIPIVHLPLFISTNGRGPARDEDSPEAERPYFLFVGRLEKLKGLQTLMPVFRHYPRARLLVAGEGSYGTRLRKLAEGSSNIRFLGRLDATELDRLYRGAVAVIVPSIAYDASPLVTLEAFRQKTPAIVRNLGGMPEAVQQSGGGFVYRTDEELIAAMDRLLADPSYRNLLGMNGYKTYREQWTPEVHLGRYFALIDKVAAAKTGAGTGSAKAGAKSPSVPLPADGRGAGGSRFKESAGDRFSGCACGPAAPDHSFPRKNS